MDAQLRLLADDRRRSPWRIDDRTRRIGKAGVVEARAALRRARPAAAAGDDVDEHAADEAAPRSHAPAA